MTGAPVTRAALLPCAAMLALTGCAFSVPLSDPQLVDAQQQRSAAIVPGESSREAVEAGLGAPWLRSRFWGVDVFRARDVSWEIGGPVILVAPIPLGVFRFKVEGYVLVTYDEAGRADRVEAASASRANSADLVPMLRAGQLSLGIDAVDDRRSPQLMADGERVQDYLALRARSSSCTLVLACEETHFERWPYESCPDQVAVDDAPPFDPQPFFGRCEPGKSCPPVIQPGSGGFVRVPLLYPLSLSPGPHRIELRSSTFRGRHETQFACAAGDVRFGTVRGRVSWHWWGPRQSTLDASVTLADAMPEGWRDRSLLLFRGGEWIALPEPGQL